MKLDFIDMDIGTLTFRFIRSLMVTGTGGAEINECLLALERTKDDSDENWVLEWEKLAEKVLRHAKQADKSGQDISARNAYFRASNYYRTAMFSLPPTDERLYRYLTLNRELFHEALEYSSPKTEIVGIPFGKAILPGYYISADPEGGTKKPTLIALNGGDSCNEETFHWIGFTAAERGWNCLTFEGPGQWSALQLNPDLPLHVEWEEELKAAVDYLLQRSDVDPENICLMGFSLSTMLASRAVSFEKRIRACVLSGGPIVDVNEAYEAVLPLEFQNAAPEVRDSMFAMMEKAEPRLASFANHYRWVFGIPDATISQLMNAWKPFNIKDLSDKIDCPVLSIMGEAEIMQTDLVTTVGIMQFIRELKCPLSLKIYSIEEDGWAASHCQMGALSDMTDLVFDWLDNASKDKSGIMESYTEPDWSLIKKYHDSRELDEILQGIRLQTV